MIFFVQVKDPGACPNRPNSCPTTKNPIDNQGVLVGLRSLYSDLPPCDGQYTVNMK